MPLSFLSTASRRIYILVEAALVYIEGGTSCVDLRANSDSIQHCEVCFNCSCWLIPSKSKKFETSLFSRVSSSGDKWAAGDVQYCSSIPSACGGGVSQAVCRFFLDGSLLWNSIFFPLFGFIVLVPFFCVSAIAQTCRLVLHKVRADNVRGQSATVVKKLSFQASLMTSPPSPPKPRIACLRNIFLLKGAGGKWAQLLSSNFLKSETSSVNFWPIDFLSSVVAYTELVLCTPHLLRCLCFPPGIGEKIYSSATTCKVSRQR